MAQCVALSEWHYVVQRIGFLAGNAPAALVVRHPAGLLTKSTFDFVRCCMHECVCRYSLGARLVVAYKLRSGRFSRARRRKCWPDHSLFVGTSWQASLMTSNCQEERNSINRWFVRILGAPRLVNSISDVLVKMLTTRASWLLSRLARKEWRNVFIFL